MTQSTRATTDTSWQLDGPVGKLRIRNLEGAVDLRSPQAGLGNLCAFAHRLEGCVLGVQMDANDGQPAATLADCYRRGSDLVAVYEVPGERPLRATIYWRAMDLATRQAAAAVDLIVSVQTDLLDATPRLQSRSQVEATIVPGPCVATPQESLSMVRPAEQATGVSPDLGCVVLPLKGVDATYCEMIHPSDWRGLETSHIDNRIELNWSLVGHFMEKGVVRRMRVRGVFFQGRPDGSLIREHYAEFSASPPPLTT